MRESLRSVYILSAIAVLLLAALFLAPAGQVEARGDPPPYVPEIIEIQQDHAWCYVLVNAQNKLVGDIHTLSCVPIFQRR